MLQILVFFKGPLLFVLLIIKLKFCNRVVLLHVCYCFFTGFGQGLRRSTGSVAAILGPLWAGAALHLYHVLLGVPLGILVGVVVSYII